MLYTETAAEKYKVYLLRRFSSYGLSRSGVVLMSRHTRYRVVEDYYCIRALVVYDIRKGGNSRMHKGGVAYYRDELAVKFRSLHLSHTVSCADGSSHTYGSIYRAERGYSAKCVTAYISRHRKPELLKNVEGSSVRASRAEHGRTVGDFFLGRDGLRSFCGKNDLFNHCRGIFT